MSADHLPQPDQALCGTVLETLLGESLDTFRTHYPSRHFVHHGPLQRFAAIMNQPDFASNECIIANFQGPVDVLWKNGQRETLADKPRLTELYQAGEVMIYITDLTYFPVLDEMRLGLADELGIPERFVGCEGFMANTQVEVDVHFDHETNFMVQLRGDKRWSLARNEALSNPLFAFFPNNPNRYYVEGRHPYSGEPLPQSMPTDATEFEVSPGSVTFLPRGYWHQTLAFGESFSIGFVVDPPTLTNLLLAHLQGQLHRDERWRAHPLADRDTVVAELEQLMHAVRTSLEGIHAEHVYQAYRGPARGTPRLLYPIG